MTDPVSKDWMAISTACEHSSLESEEDPTFRLCHHSKRGESVICRWKLENNDCPCNLHCGAQPAKDSMLQPITYAEYVALLRKKMALVSELSGVETEISLAQIRITLNRGFSR